MRLDFGLVTHKIAGFNQTKAESKTDESTLCIDTRVANSIRDD